jgi:hypothetical protein
MLRLSITAEPSRIGIVGRNGVLPAIVEPQSVKATTRPAPGQIEIRHLAFIREHLRFSVSLNNALHANVIYHQQ